MINRTSAGEATKKWIGRCAAACLVMIAGPIGCGGSAPEPAATVTTTTVKRTTAPKTKSGPTVTPIAQLMTRLGIDERVILAEEHAPGTDAARKAVLVFFDSFARGDDQALGSMLSSLDRMELEELVDSGAWKKATDAISRIQVRTGQSPDGQPCAMAIHFVADDFQPQLWYYRLDGDTATFDAVASPPDLMDKVGGTDLIAAWFELLASELALADEPDEEFAMPQKNFTETASSSGRPRAPANPVGPGPGPSSPGKPSAPPGNPGRRAPNKGRRPAPGKG